MRVTILTNGPGELWGWVRPVASELRKRGHSISMWLLPCQFSSGHEREAASLLGVDKLEGPSSASVIWRDITREKTDCVIQLGGDIMFGLRMSKSAGIPLTAYSYRHRKEIPGVKLLTAYLEQMNISSAIPIGDLEKDAVNLDITPQSQNAWNWPQDSSSPRILLLPGSRPSIRLAAMEWLCGVQEALKAKIPGVRIRTLFPQFMPENELAQWRKSGLNPVRCPAGVAMKEADYAITQPGTNNFEMMHCGLPGLVVAPEKFIKHIPVAGMAGILAGIPIIGNIIKLKALYRVINSWGGYISLPNRTFKREILTELYGDISPNDIAAKTASDLADIERLRTTHDELLRLSGESGAASRLCDIASAGGEAI